MASRPRFLMILGYFFYVSLAMVAAVCVAVGLTLATDGEWKTAAGFAAFATGVFLLGLGMRRLLAGY